MIHIVKYILISLLFCVVLGCHNNDEKQSAQLQIAFMADVHLQDVYGTFNDTDYKGVLNPGNGKYVMARTMQAQLHSTRIFNENYFAFLAALDDVAQRGVKYVVLPGDFSDDGQPINVRGLQRILDTYTQKHGIHFLATTGNHDPVRPYATDAGKTNFMGEGGKSQTVMSKEGLYISKNKDEHPVVITQDIRKMGYKEIIASLHDFGFFPKKTDLYWETPFTKYAYDDYDFLEAQRQAVFEHRKYLISPYYTPIPDVSYLVEPEKDVWFLAIDANVYVPSEKVKGNPEVPANYKSASIGYKNVLTHKKHLIEWVKEVTQRAEKYGKTLIVFSHYPMVDFNDDATSHIKKLMGEGKMQMHRVPEENVARIFANAGIKLHFGGHMHINDTGIRKSEKGNCLINVQVPSLAAYVPAYKLLTVKSKDLMEVETIVLDSVPRFKELFPLYEKEHDYLNSIKAGNIWNKDILTVSTYHEFTSWHLRELVRLRFLKSDWPEDFKDFLLKSSGRDLLMYSKATLNESEKILKEYDSWTGFDMIYDFYRLRSADKLAIKDIGWNRIQQYQLINSAILKQINERSPMFVDFQNFATVLHHFLNGAPADHFLVDLEKGEITDLID
ncbi:metallophosphoesterase [Saccharicrinis sp. GN24d3]|uniref:metallophosphoesterase n=1 Tax=Saccharicrinis sp. GN24d3 TaxID=3458416 RepID=UPI004036D50E